MKKTKKINCLHHWIEVDKRYSGYNLLVCLYCDKCLEQKELKFKI